MSQKRWALLLVLCFLAGCLTPALAEITFPLTEEPVTLRFVARQAPNHADYGDMLVWQKYEALTNVHIDWIMIPQANYTER
nr:hypothetical protein [Clostridia bacterium]